MAMSKYPASIAWDKGSRKGVAGVVGKVFDASNGIPVDTFDMAGNPAPLVTNADGYVGAFQTLPEVTHVDAKFGNVTLPLVSTQAILDAASGALGAQAAAEAASQLVEAPADVVVATLVEGDTLTKTALSATIGEQAVLRGELEVNVKDFGAQGDGVSDDYAAIMAALTSGARKVYAPEGLCMTSDEIKVPTDGVFYGAGIDITVIKTFDGVAPDKNTITNAGNTRLERTTYDENISVRDMTIDGNGWNRPNTSTFNQGSCLKLSTVRKFRVANVRAINGPLHCIDVMASIYQSDAVSNVNTVMAGPSHAGVLENVIGEDSVRDDGITTHGSHDLTIINPRATRTRPAGDTSQGIEIDEGCYRVTVIAGYANGWTKGFQVKGHNFTTPAYDVNLISCVAENCSMGFDISHIHPSSIPAGQSSWAKNVTLTDPVVINPVQQNATYTELRGLQIRGYAGTVVRNITLRGGAHNNITIDAGAKGTVLDGVRGIDVWTAPPSLSQGFIHFFNGAGVGHTVKNVVVDNPIATSVITSNGTGHELTIDGVKATGSDPTKPCVVRQGLVAGDSCKGISQTGFLSDLSVTAGTYAGAYKGLSLDKNFAATFTGAGTPEAVVAAFIGSIYRNTSSATQPLWVKSTGNANTGWKALTLAA